MKNKLRQEWIVFGVIFLIVLVPSVLAAVTNTEFVGQTPSNGSTQPANSIFVNLSTTSSLDHYTFVDFDSSLVGWWRMDDVNASGDIVDLSSNAINGSIVGTVLLNVTGRFGNASYFNGSGSYFRLGTPSQLHYSGGEMTIAAWVYPNGSIVVGNSFVKRGAAGSTGSNTNNFDLAPYSSNRVFFSIGNTSSNNYILSATNALTANTWNFVACGINTTHLYCYVNGVLSGTPTVRTMFGGYYSADNTTLIGAGRTTGNYFNGSIDEVLIFNRSLLQQEILALYNATANKYYRNFTNLSQGTYSFRGYAVDASGDKNQTDLRYVQVNFSTIAPIANLVSPANGTNSINSSYFFVGNFTDETALKNSTFYLWNSTNDLINATATNINGTSNSTSLNVSLPAEGTYHWNYRVADTDGNLAFAAANYTVIYNSSLDVTPPSVTINSPISGTVYSSLPMNITFNVTLNEAGNVFYSLNGSANVSMSSSDSLNFYHQNTSVLIADGNYTVRFYANDSLGNINYTATVNFIVNTSVGNATMIEQDGIIWYFNQSVTYGRFANGDFWVKGPVNITNITPEFNGTMHGWVVNPTYFTQEGFDSRSNSTGFLFNASLVPSLPYTASGNKSIIKVISNESANPVCGHNSAHTCYLLSGAVLTVMDANPPSNGASVFRPSYFGNDKTYNYVSELQTSWLPSWNTTSNALNFSYVERNIQRLQLDYYQTAPYARPLHPDWNMKDYGSEIAVDNAEGILMLMTNHSLAEKWNTLIYFTQAGIDYHRVVQSGGGWAPAGGHGEGRKQVIVFAATILNNTEMKNTLSSVRENYTIFAEEAQVNENLNGVPVWGLKNLHLMGTIIGLQ